MKKKTRKTLMSTGDDEGTVEWGTPPKLFSALHKEFRFTLDPCASADNAKCGLYFTKEDDGLSKSWKGFTVFENYPYGRGGGVWVEKAYSESQEHGITVVVLMPVRTCTKWWHDYVMKADEVRLFKGRLRFIDYDKKVGGVYAERDAATFPSALAVFRPHKGDTRFCSIKAADYR